MSLSGGEDRSRNKALVASLAWHDTLLSRLRASKETWKITVSYHIREKKKLVIRAERGWIEKKGEKRLRFDVFIHLGRNNLFVQYFSLIQGDWKILQRAFWKLSVDCGATFPFQNSRQFLCSTTSSLVKMRFITSCQSMTGAYMGK